MARRTYCCVFGCLNNTSISGLSFFRIPTDKERALEWLRLINREDLLKKKAIRSSVVCENHFHPGDIMRKPHKKILSKTSAPRLQLPRKKQVDRNTQVKFTTYNISTQTEACCASANEIIDLTIATSSSQADVSTTNKMTETTTVVTTSTRGATAPLSASILRRKKLASELLKFKKRLQAIEIKKYSQKMFRKLCDRYLSEDLAELVKAQINLKCGNKENRYTIDYKVFCLNLDKVRPQDYHLLEKTISPWRSTFEKQNISMTTQINEKLMTVLKLKVNNMSEREKYCTLIMDTIRLKTNVFYDIKNDKLIGFHEVDGAQSPKPAKYALVIIIRGIFVKWSQPIGYALLSECLSDSKVNKWVNKLIMKLFKIGLKIRACVSNMAPNFITAAKDKGVCPNKTYFTVIGHKIYYIFDAPHLMKLVRDYLMVYDFHFQNDAVAKYSHIKQFYEHDKQKMYKQAHKLTNNHVYPTNAAEIKVCYATQLLSRSVATGLSTYVDFNVIDVSARHTVKLIMLMNDLFDVLNSSSLRGSCKYKRAFYGRKEQIDFLNRMLSFFQTLELRDPQNENDVTKNVNFIQGFQITIQSILHLYEDLKQEGYEYILTRRLNQDVMEKFFNKIRSRNGNTLEPTTRQFISAYRKIFIANITSAPKEGTKDCKGSLVNSSDYKNTHKDATDISSDQTTINNAHPEILQTNIDLRDISRSDYMDFDIPKNDGILYVSGVLLKKCVDRHKGCKKLQTYLSANQKVCNLSGESVLCQISIVLPPDNFVRYIKKMEQIFKKAFQYNYIKSKIGVYLYEQIQDLYFSLPCPCFPKVYLQKLYIRMRIYYTLKCNNKSFRYSQNSENIFSVSNL